MTLSFRRFEAGPDPFGRTWKVEFEWLQTATSIRHADAVDVKFAVDWGEGRRERVISLPHPLLLKLSQSLGRPVTDAWCARLAAIHLRQMIETGEDIERTLVTVREEDLARHGAALQRAA